MKDGSQHVPHVIKQSVDNPSATQNLHGKNHLRDRRNLMLMDVRELWTSCRAWSLSILPNAWAPMSEAHDGRFSYLKALVGHVTEAVSKVRESLLVQ